MESSAQLKTVNSSFQSGAAVYTSLASNRGSPFNFKNNNGSLSGGHLCTVSHQLKFGFSESGFPTLNKLGFPETRSASLCVSSDNSCASKRTTKFSWSLVFGIAGTGGLVGLMPRPLSVRADSNLHTSSV